MGLIYCGASIYGGTYSGNYLMHGRTVGSRNGISNTPGYKAKGELAKGRWVNGVYIPAERDTFNARVGNVNASLAKKNLRAGNAGGTARYAGQTVRSYAKQAGKDIRRATNIAYNNTREFVTGEHAKAYLDSLLEQKKGTERAVNAKGVVPDNVRKSNEQLLSEIERAQKLYDRTLPGMIDKAKYVGGKAWNSVKTAAEPVMKKARSFIENLWGKVKEFGGSAWKKIQPIATEIWSKVKEKGSEALTWGKRMLDKVIGPVKEFAAGMVEGVGRAAKDVGNTLKATGKTIGKTVDDIGKAANDTAKNVGSAVETAAKETGKAIKTAGDKVGDTATQGFNALAKSYGEFRANLGNIQPWEIKAMSPAVRQAIADNIESRLVNIENQINVATNQDEVTKLAKMYDEINGEFDRLGLKAPGWR